MTTQLSGDEMLLRVTTIVGEKGGEREGKEEEEERKEKGTTILYLEEYRSVLITPTTTGSY